MNLTTVLLIASGEGPTDADVELLREGGIDDVVALTVYPTKPAGPESDAPPGTPSLGPRVRNKARRIRRTAKKSLRLRLHNARASAASLRAGPDAIAPTAQRSTLSERTLRRLEAAIAQVDATLDQHPDTGMLIALDLLAARVAWHIADARSDVLAVNGIDAALHITNGRFPPRIDLSPLAALIDSPESIYPSLPDLDRLQPRVLVTAKALDLDTVTALAATRPRTDVIGLTVGEPVGLSLVPNSRALLVRARASDLNSQGLPATLRVIAADETVSGLDPSSMPPPDDRVAPEPEPNLLIGPANYAGQGAAWARALGTHGGITARNLSVVPPASPFTFPADVPMTSVDWADPIVRARAALEAVLPATHVFVEALRPILGLGSPVNVDAWDPAAGFADVVALRESGRGVAVVIHGSEGRRPSDHMARYPMSPFARPEHAAEMATRTRTTDAVHALLADLDVPVLVTTPDMLDFVPGATWLPIVVGPTSFNPGRPLFSERLPVVMHAPSSGPLKGSEHVDVALDELHQEGLIDYRRLSHVPPSLVASYLRDADIVVDQVVLGNPGVLAAQAMACGRVVVAHLNDDVRSRFDSPIPVVDATPDTLREVIRGLVADQDAAVEAGAAGPGFTQSNHDGRRSAQVLLDVISRM